MLIECPVPAYNRLVKSGLVKKLADKKELIKDILLSACFEINAEDIFEDVRRKIERGRNEMISERTQLYADINSLDVEIKEEGGEFYNKEEKLMNNPSLLAFAVLGEEVLGFQKFGFPSRRSLEESITSFCIGERHLLYMDSDYIWRNGKFKNTISNSNHGDLYFGQVDISGKDAKVQTLFGFEEEFDAFKKTENSIKNANAHHDCWGNFLAATLKYAEAIGKIDIPEIKNWKETLSNTGSVPTFTAEAEFGESGHEVLLSMLKDSQIMREGEMVKTFPLYIPSSGNTDYYPYYSKDGKLFYLTEEEKGEIKMPVEAESRFAGLRLSKYIEYSQEDLPHLLKGTYRMFARDRRLLPKIMREFV